MAKLCITSFDFPSDDLSRKRFELHLRLEITKYALDGKINLYKKKQINYNTWSREWDNDQAVEEFCNFFPDLFSKYGGTLHYIEVVDI